MSNTVILGSGIIGLSTAFYLSESGNTPPESIHLVDPIADLFHCASGYAGGFLAEDWFAPSVASLGALSFRLHRELAEKYNGKETWGYSQSTGMSYSQGTDSDSAIGGSGEDWLQDGTSRAQASGGGKAKADEGPVWLKRAPGGSMEVISKDKSTAQIDPWRFCRFLLEQCLQRGVQLHQPARAISVSKNEVGHLDGVRISKDGTELELPCARLVITSGAWSPRIFSTLFPKSSVRIPVSHLAGHAILLRNHFFNKDAEEMCHAVFATDDNLGFSPEYFSRAGGQIYLAGLNSTMIALPDTASDAKANPKAVQQMIECAKSMMGTVADKEIEVLRGSVCFRPVTASGRPIIARIQDPKLGAGFKTQAGEKGGVYIAAGHGAWGISQSAGTGLCLAELIEGRKTSAKLDGLGLS